MPGTSHTTGNERIVTQWLHAANERRPFVLLDTNSGTGDDRRSLFFERPVDTLRLYAGGDIGAFFDDLESALGRGLWAAGYVGYEFGYEIEPALHRLRTNDDKSPLVWMGLFESPVEGSGTLEIARAEPSDPAVESGSDAQAALEYELDHLGPDVSEADYTRAIDRIHEVIAGGHTYQVNYTFKHRMRLRGSFAGLYLDLRRRQPVAYSACLDDGTRRVASLSPELFFRCDGDALTTRPMKGTAHRGRSATEDAAIARWLHQDAKNRAENVMIVDMIRNDLGRISRTGSVHVDGLFDVERYRTLFQMTSTIRSQLRNDVGWREIFTSMFPCASVTGAPKVRTMELIAGLETGPRGVYTGSIGYIAPNGDACFNVAIRTIVADEDGNAELGLGSGVVIDSLAANEYRECLLKSRFLTPPETGFQLVETLLVENGAVAFLDEHRERIVRSADCFGFVCRGDAIEERIRSVARRHGEGRYRLRVLVDEAGNIETELESLRELRPPLRATIDGTAVRSDDPFLFHKTTRRAGYDRAIAAAREDGYDEVLFVNERGELTEGTFTNLFVEIDGIMFTPPLDAGILPGVLRETMLRAGDCAERTIKPEDLARASAVLLGNSVRGLMPASVSVSTAPR